MYIFQKDIIIHMLLYVYKLYKTFIEAPISKNVQGVVDTGTKIIEDYYF